MSKQLLNQEAIINMAEGSPRSYEVEETISPLKTATMPAVRHQHLNSKGETGITAMVDVHAEGEDADESQDASRTTDETSQVPETDPVAVKKKKADEKPTILIVEDTMELAEVIQATLENMGLNSIFETHGQKALAKFKELNPQVVLMDIGLPDMTGWKVLDSIKEFQQASENGKMPTIIVITAYGDPANRLVGKLQGIHSYLIKPFTPDQVEDLVSRALKGEPAPDTSVDQSGKTEASG